MFRSSRQSSMTGHSGFGQPFIHNHLHAQSWCLTIWCIRFAAPSPVGPAPMMRTSTSISWPLALLICRLWCAMVVYNSGGKRVWGSSSGEDAKSVEECMGRGDNQNISSPDRPTYAYAGPSREPGEPGSCSAHVSKELQFSGNVVPKSNPDRRSHPAGWRFQ